MVVETPPALFALPALTWLPDERRALKTPAGADPPELGDWSDPASLGLALVALDPMMRALELAGYVTSLIHLGASSSGAAPASWVEIDPALMHVAAVPVADEWPAGARFAARLQVDPRRTATNRSLAILGTQLDPMPFDSSWSTEETNHLVFHSQQAVVGAGDLLDAIEASGIPLWVEQAVTGLAGRWTRIDFYGDLNPSGPETDAAPGLLWIFDPRFWDTDPPTWTNTQAPRAIDAAQYMLAEANKDVPRFIRAQVTAATRSDLREATVGGLLEGAMDEGHDARNLKRDYFAAMENQFLWAVERAGPDESHTAQGLEIAFDKGTFHDVCGQRWIGYPSGLRYLDVILFLAESRLLPFPALLHPELSYAFEFEEDPVQVVMTDDELGVEIRILGSEPIVVKRDIDSGYPVEQCLTWEYMGADPEGIATLMVVAAPGVSVSGREHVVPSWRLVVLRIQNHDLVPPWGEHIQTTALTAPEDEGSLYACDLAMFEDGDATEGLGWEIPRRPASPFKPAPAFRLRPLPLGMRITYPAAEESVRAELAVDIKVGEGAAGDRFSYWIEPMPPVEGGDADQRQPYRLIVRATPGVQITVQHNFLSAVEEVFQRATAITGIDPPGVPMSAELAEMELRGVTKVEDTDEFFRAMLWVEYQWLFLFSQLGADVAIGMIPLVGDAVDIAEFLGSFLTGTDKWGHPVTSVDRAIMFGAILLPGVSSGALRGVKAALGG